MPSSLIVYILSICRGGVIALSCCHVEMEDVKRLAESLGALLSTDPSDEQKKNFDLYIQYALNNQYLEKVINYPIQRYNGRTLVHIAADKGLPEYLEILLANGGQISDRNPM